MNEKDILEAVKEGIRRGLRKGGAGSGNFGHSGRPGHVGGSGEGSSGSGSGSISPVTPSDREAIAFRQLQDYRDFIDSREKLTPKQKAYLTPYTVKEMKDKGLRVFLSEDKQTGFVIAPDGDFGNLFSRNHHGGDAIREAIRQGAKKLDCFDDGRLPKIYAKFGFVEYKREPNWEPGGPDVVYMRLAREKMIMKEMSDWEKFKDKKRREMVDEMKKNGISFQEATDAFIDMLGEEEK